MALRVGFAYNQKPPRGADEPPGSPSHDRYAEWDDPETIDAVAAALSRAGQVIRLEATEDLPSRLRETSPDIVFNIAEGLHGPNREAHVPAICEFLDIPYTASDPLTLCLGLDKRRTKEVLLARGIATPRWVVAEPGKPLKGADKLHLPAMVKPLFEGSSKGIDVASFCESPEQLRRKVEAIHATYGQPALVEEFLGGREFTVAIIGNGPGARALPLVEIAFDSLPEGAPPIYGYEAKWVWDTTEEPLEIFSCPAPVDEELAQAVERAALAAYHALGCRDWARIDLRLDAEGVPHVLELNPLPGILPDPRQNSCFPKAARAAGLSYDGLLLTVLREALARYGLEDRFPEHALPLLESSEEVAA